MHSSWINFPDWSTCSAKWVCVDLVEGFLSSCLLIEPAHSSVGYYHARGKYPVYDSTSARTFQWVVKQELSHCWKWFKFSIRIDYEQSGSLSWRGGTSHRSHDFLSCLKSVRAWCTLSMGCVSFFSTSHLSFRTCYVRILMFFEDWKQILQCCCVYSSLYPWVFAFPSYAEIYPTVTDSDICLGL